MQERVFVAVALVIAAALTACDHDTSKLSCFDMSAPGVIVYNTGIDLLVRDKFGRGEALGTTVTVHQSSDSLVTTGTDTLHVNAGYTNAGTFSVHVSRPFYRDTVLTNVVVQAGDCSVLTTHVALTLQLAAGSPAIRAIAILGADFLVNPGEQRHLTARFDADPNVPTTVIWRLSDAALAQIDNDGVVTAKCSLAGGTETVAAIATADTTARGSARFGVQKQTTC